jgi:hypothetical protein
MALGPTQRRIEELKAAGVKAELLVLDGITHYQTPRFAEPLKKAVPWLKAVWQ